MGHTLRVHHSCPVQAETGFRRRLLQFRHLPGGDGGRKDNRTIYPDRKLFYSANGRLVPGFLNK